MDFSLRCVGLVFQEFGASKMGFRRRFFGILVFSAFLLFSFAQTEAQNKKMILRSMSFKDKMWAVGNINSINKALEVSQQTLATMDSLRSSGTFENISEGSRFDAFRHVFWMYSLASEIGVSKARRIGVIYENYNRYTYELYKGDGHDKAGRQMDEYNNEVGLHLFSKVGKRERSFVLDCVTDLISKGQVKIVAKDSLKRSLNRAGEVIPDSLWRKSWENERYLIDSNKER